MEIETDGIVDQLGGVTFIASLDATALRRRSESFVLTERSTSTERSARATIPETVMKLVANPP